MITFLSFLSVCGRGGEGRGCGMQSTEHLGGPGPIKEGRGSHLLELEFQAVVSLYVEIFKAIYL